ncbi:MAG: TOBE domain-containing protein [Coriobacteriales bacterium]|jgi:molybdate transport system regulatory protein
MKISARNQLKGIISAVTEGAVNGVVTIEVGDQTIKADITMESIDQLGLKEGKTAYAIIKATNVMFATGNERIKTISARNQLPGTITAVKKGAVNGHVSLKLADGNVVSGSITNAAIEDLDLKVGDPALAVIKATDVIVGVDD